MCVCVCVCVCVTRQSSLLFFIAMRVPGERRYGPLTEVRLALLSTIIFNLLFLRSLVLNNSVWNGLIKWSNNMLMLPTILVNCGSAKFVLSFCRVVPGNGR